MVKIHSVIPEELEKGLENILESVPEMISSPAYQYDHYKKILTPPEDPFIDMDRLDMLQDVPIGLQENLNTFNPVEAEKILIEGLTKLYPTYNIRISGRNIYPPGGHLGWHTNSNHPGKRIYLTHVEEGNKSFFRYIKDRQQITSYDKPGWNMREFEIDDNPLWHCVYTDVERLSIGFSLT